MPDLVDIIGTTLLSASLAISATAVADVSYAVKGVDEPLRGNVLAYVDTVQFGPTVRISPQDIDRATGDAIANARSALRPFGYYAPTITARIVQPRSDNPVIELTIDPGVPVRVSSADVRVMGAGSEHRQIRQWLRRFPIAEGDILDQTIWEVQKQLALDAATSRGFLNADFAEHALEIDLEKNTADIRLVLDTGPRFVMGDIDFGEHMLKPGILEFVPRFDKGDPYTEQLMDRFRGDLWKTGYFTDVEVIEQRDAEVEPPVVDLGVTLETKTRNRYSGALGYGTDIGVRAQLNWTRSPVSANGDRLDLGIGWQELDDKTTLRGLYRFPRRGRQREFWMSELVVRNENEDLEVKREQDDEDFIKLASGDVNEQNLRLGREKIRYVREGDLRLEDILFVQFLNSDRDFTLVDPQLEQSLLSNSPEFDKLLSRNDQPLSIGVELGTIDVQGRSFEAVGSRDRAWAFHSDDAFGSNVEFTQVYLSTRRSYLWGDNFKFLVRAEVGYSDAEVFDISVDTASGPLSLSITELPNFYRFKAGGSHSVRGYGFEQLSNNDIGSNNIITASVEGEYRFLPSWSGAVFFDIGNAFNDWSDPNLKRGVGVGVRWYSFVGEIRLDLATALDFEGDPLRVHLTIGTPLL